LKKLLVVLAMVLLMAPSAVLAEELTASWSQASTDVLAPNFVGWNLYMAVDLPGGPYQKVADIEFDGTAGNLYSADVTIQGVLGTHVYYFVLRAETLDEESDPSNEAQVTITKDISGPMNFTIKIKVQ